ncbi:hypothetical protein L2475_02140 [Lactobacillus gasseri]|nr:hypothetical protein [Lactobacillus gasseri]
MIESKVFNGGREYEKIINDFIIKLATEKKEGGFFQALAYEYRRKRPKQQRYKRLFWYGLDGDELGRML